MTTSAINPALAQAKLAAQTSREMLLQMLQAAGADTRNPKMFKCPFHEDTHPSGGVFQSDDGVWRYKCLAASCGWTGDVFDVQAKVTGRRVEDILSEMAKLGLDQARKPNPAPAPPAERSFADIEEIKRAFPAIVAVFPYTNPTTRKPDLVVFRLEPGAGGKKKSFMQATPTPTGNRLVLKGLKGALPLYNRVRMASHPKALVVLVEGEKCVHCLHDLGYLATTAPGGAGPGKAANVDWTPLAGRDVVCWADNDEGGLAYMRAAADQLLTLLPPAAVRWVDVPNLGLPEKGDVVDLVAKATDPAAQKAMVEATLSGAAPLGLAAGLNRLVEDIIAGRRRNYLWQPDWKYLNEGVRCLLPQTTTVICGDPGCAKSPLILQCIPFWLASGYRPAVFMLEENREYHLHRILAQLACLVDVLDDQWVRDHPDKMRELLAKHSRSLEAAGSCLTIMGEEQPTVHDLLAWGEERAAAGCDILVIDPITMAKVSERSYMDDLAFIAGANRLMRKHEQVRLILVTHPRKGKRTNAEKVGGALDDLAGGAAFQRFSQSVLWIQPHDNRKNLVDLPNGQRGDAEHNRTIHVKKARNGRGWGWPLAYTFWNNLGFTFTEQGLIVHVEGTQS